MGLRAVALLVAMSLFAGYWIGSSRGYGKGYEMGIHDGAVTLCDQIGQFNKSMEQALRRARIC